VVSRANDAVVSLGELLSSRIVAAALGRRGVPVQWVDPRDLVATDGQKFTLGDATVMMYFTPGHTPGTISSVFQVKDNGKSHTVALWGGMGLNNDRASLTQYIASNKKFQDVAKQAGADIILSNHTDRDRSKINLPILANRAPGSPNPYVTNNASVLRYLKVAEECATAKVMRLN